MKSPNGYFEDGYSVWDQGKNWIISRGCDVQVPDLSTSDSERWMALEGCLRRMLGILAKDERLQVIFYTGSNFGSELKEYDSVEASGICGETRKEFSDYFHDRMLKQTLIRSTVRIYIAKKVNNERRSAFEEIFSVVKREMEQRFSYFEITMRSMGGSARVLDAMEGYQDLLKYWSPGQTPRSPDWEDPIGSLCLHGDIAPRKETEHGFFLDGYYVGEFVVKKMPRQTWPKSMDPFFNLCKPGVRVTLNILPLSVSEEIRHEDDRDSKLSKNEQKPSVVAGRTKHLERVIRLQSNDAVPFKCQIIVTVLDKNKDAVDDRMEAVRSALDSVGFQSYRPDLPVAAIRFFNCACPGFGPFYCNDIWHKIDDDHLSHLIPAGSSAEVAGVDWVACGNRNDMIGGNLFIGSQPANMLCCGTTGSGKTVLMETILIQAAHQFKFIAVIDNGSSWMETCKNLDPECRPIVVGSQSGHTFNPLDTKGLALSSEHKRSAIALCELLVGPSTDQDRQADRSDLLSSAISTIYDREFRYWKNKNPELYYQACQKTVCALRSNVKFVDAVQSLKEDNCSQVTEEEVIRLKKDNESKVQNYVFSTWTPEMFPTLYDIWEELNSRKFKKGASAHCEGLANRLKPWLSNGDHGPLVDGISNVDLGTAYVNKDSPLKVVYFELGAMKETEEELRSIIGFLITTELRAIIQNMPRGIKKAMIIEELTAFLRVPNSAKILMDFSERMRKYMCWMAYIFQQYQSLLSADKAVAETLFGNAQSMILLRNVNGEEIDALNAHMTIPGPIKDAIKSFPMPESLKGKPDQHAGFVHVQKSGPRPIFTIGRNVISSRLEQIVGSSGDQFEAKMKRLSAA